MKYVFSHSTDDSETEDEEDDLDFPDEKGAKPKNGFVFAKYKDSFKKHGKI